MPNQAFCLVCAKCGRAVTTRNGLVRSKMETLPASVYPYELGMLDCASWCYSVTDAEDGRFDIVCTRVGPLVNGVSPSGRLQGFICSADPSVTANLICLNTRPESEPDWFPGFVRRPVYCTGCTQPSFLGWAFSREMTPHSDFLALIITGLRERHVDPSKPVVNRKVQIGRKSTSVRNIPQGPLPQGPLTRGQEEILSMRSRNRSGSRASFAELNRERMHENQGPHPQVLRRRLGLADSAPTLPASPGAVSAHRSERASNNRAANVAPGECLEKLEALLSVERQESSMPRCLRCEENIVKCRCGILQVSSFGSPSHPQGL